MPRPPSPRSKQDPDASRLAALVKMFGLDRPFCRVYVSDETLLIHASTVSAVPTLHPAEPYLRLSRSTDSREIGKAVLDALTAYRLVDDPIHEDLESHPLLRLAHASDWESLTKSFVMLSVEDRGPTRLRVVPYAGTLREEYLEKRCGRDPGRIGNLVLRLGGEAYARHRDAVAANEAPPEPEPVIPPDDNTPEPFGYKTSWLAVRADDPMKVAKSLGLKNVSRATWREGLAKAYDREAFFVTPAVGGWVMVVGHHLPNADLPEFVEELQSASQRLDEVFWFGTHRIVEYHAWAKADNGKVRRAYAYLGESGKTLRDVGEMTPEESSLGFGHFDDQARTLEVRVGRRKFRTWPNEESVMQIAGAWSIDPSRIERQDDPEQRGVIGEFAKQARKR